MNSTLNQNVINQTVPSVEDEWRPVTLATIKDRDQVVRALTEAISGKHSPLKNKAIYLRIKPHSQINVVRSKTFGVSTVKDEGWDVDMDVATSISTILKEDSTEGVQGLDNPIAFVNFDKVAVDQTDADPATGFWFQIKDLEWKLV